MAKTDVTTREMRGAHGERRYLIVDKTTGEVLDDAQGYGYRTPQKAYAAWGYKHRDRSKDTEKAKKTQHIRAWLRQHRGFAEAMDEYYFEIEVKHSWSPEDHFNAAFVQQMLDDYDLHPDFTAAELLRVWGEKLTLFWRTENTARLFPFLPFFGIFLRKSPSTM